MIPRNANERMSAWLERAWLQNYLERALDAEESAWFEAYVLDKPELLSAIEADTDLRDGLAVLAGDGSDAAAPIASSATDRARASSNGSRWLALAATLVVGLGVGLLVPRARPDGGLAPTANPARIVYDTMRGESVAPQFEPEALAGADVLLVEVAVPSTATDVELRLDSQSPRPLRVSADGFVSFLLPRPLAATLGKATIGFSADGERRDLEILFPTQ